MARGKVKPVMKWRWTPKGVIVTRPKKAGGAREFFWKADYPGDRITAALEAFAGSQEIYAHIAAALREIRSGSAPSYKGAALKVAELIRERQIAEDNCNRAAAELDAAFEPAGLMAWFGNDVIGILKFSEEFVLQHAKRMLRKATG